MKRWIAALLAAVMLLACMVSAGATEDPDAPPTEAPTIAPIDEPTDEPTDDPAETWTLTIHYIYEDGSEAAEDYVQAELAEGDPYEVTSPAIEGKVPDPETVEGTMPNEDVELDVVYRAVAPAQTWTLTIHYVFEEGGEAAPDCVQADLSEGDPYSVASPAVEGKSPDPATVSGTMPGADVEITVVYRTPSAEGWTLRIRYQLEDGSEAAPDYVRTGMKAGDAYEVVSPSVQYMKADKPVVSGAMGEGDMTVVVTYKIGGGSGGFGGFSGYGGYSGSMGAAEGMTEDMGFTVTPGEAFTSIHTSGDKDDSLYGTVALEADAEPMLALTLGGEALDISLTAGGSAAEFTAEIRGGALILRGADGTWNIGGDALKALKQSGIVSVVLLGDNNAASVPTAGFASGYDYDRLRASGLPSSAFLYAVEPSSGSVAMEADGEAYALSGDGVRFGTPEEVMP